MTTFAEIREQRAQRCFGCSYAEKRAIEIEAGNYGVGFAYYHQRIGAGRRGIGWHFTFPTWWAVWQASGKWKQRGRRLGQYVMCRHGDTGPYSPSNVSIATCSENGRQRRREVRAWMAENPPAEVAA